MDNNRTYIWGHSRRYNAASNSSKMKYGSRIQKVTIDAGFTCPNRDGSKSTGGCTFCNNDAFNPSYCMPSKTVAQQIDEGMSFHKGRYKNAGNYFAYFQAFSNTYASVPKLRELYNEALSVDGVIGLIIGTRPDCLPDDVLDLLEEYNDKCELVVEIGIESIYNKTLEIINRGHTFEETREACEKLNKRNILCGGHMIWGLPGESKQMMLDSAAVLSALPLYSLKFHQLQIVKDTQLAETYLKDKSSFTLFKTEEYIEFIVAFLELLNPEIIIERLAGETQPRHNLGVRWNMRYDQVLTRIENRMKELDTWQGKKFLVVDSKQ